ncbi:MAG: peptidoglycan DD-metalloendopeptidase family protein [Betaproteobacteria bacterium]|nr:peptidoglycan DD-metalloendopeptidase family protein [Betaproteobacteria bacterium]
MARSRALCSAPGRKAVRSDVRFFVCLCVAAIVAGCAVRHPAPVVERAPGAVQAAKPAARPAPPPAAVRASEAPPEFYTVKRGETLYGIALDHGLEYREVAEWNQITDPSQIRAGQVLRMRAPAQAAVTEGAVQVRPVTSAGKVESRPLEGSVRSVPPASALAPGTSAAASGPVKTEPRAYKLPFSAENVALMSRGEAVRSEPRPEPKSEIKPEQKQPVLKPEQKPAVLKPEPQGDDDEKVDWGWPSSGRVLAGFSDPVNKGVDVGGKIGDPVFASASGRVVYSGAGLRGYGKLVIIKHNKTFLSAYAHNHQILVKEGQQVIKGQKIAEIGDTDADTPRLHFEIRRLGKPVDPLKFLPERPS